MKKNLSRAESRILWESIANGDLLREQDSPVDLQEWIREVAKEILAADETKKSVDRPYHITRAVGLAGVADEHHRLRELIAITSEFPFLDDQGNERKPIRGERMKTLVAMARLHELVDENSSDIEIRKLIERLNP